jgi:hypothetical protein
MREAQQQAAQPAKSAYTLAELKEHLQEYQMEAIRQGQPPLPIPLTPESEAQLAKEGFLPPYPSQTNSAVPATRMKPIRVRSGPSAD